MIKIGIIDDNKQLTQVLEDYFSTLPDIEVKGVAHNGHDGLKLIHEEQLDLILLDLIMPHTDGLSLLEKLYTEHIGTKVLMLTAFGKEDIIQQTSQYGASYFLLKPFELPQLATTIRAIFQKTDGAVARKIIKPIMEEPVPVQVPQVDSLELRITEVLRTMGIPANLKGYLFLRDAIKMMVEDVEGTNVLGGITKILYPTIAKKYHTTPSRVERAIRHSIEVGWNRGNLEMVEHVFGNLGQPLKNKPTNGKFITLVADYLQMQKVS